MVSILGWGFFFLIIGFGAGRLRLHANMSKPKTARRSKKNLTTEQISNLLFALYVGFVVATIQNVVETFDSLSSPKVSTFILACLSFLMALIIQYLFLNRKSTTQNQFMSTADELEKLAFLQKKGLLTQSEFESEKSKLLNS